MNQRPRASSASVQAAANNRARPPSERGAQATVSAAAAAYSKAKAPANASTASTAIQAGRPPYVCIETNNHQKVQASQAQANNQPRQAACRAP